ncbi:MAG TPA: GNAT family N-acetyltransferase [Chryseosolibacter sp.]
MDIKHDQTDSKGVFFIGEKNKPLAEMTYSKAGAETIIIDHTQVSDELKGKGAGKQLVTAAVDYARQNGIKIIPLCPFARSVFEKVTEFRDVLK